MIRWTRRAASLSAAEWQLLMRAAITVAVARATLSAAGVQGARRAARAAVRLIGSGDDQMAPWAVSRSAKLVPAATCLTQALALEALFTAAGRPCQVEIGVATHPAFQGHAWVVSGGEVVLGEREVARFQRVGTL